MRKLRIKMNIEESIDTLIEKSTDNWNELCDACTALVKDAQMSDNDIDEIVTRVREVNG